MADEVNEQTPNPLFLVDDSTKEFFETYVGPGKKYPNIGELAKAYANADNHIKDLTTDTTKYKTEAESLKELLMDNLINPNPKPNENPNPNPNVEAPESQPNPNEAPPKEGEIDVKALVKEALAEVSTEDTRKKNAQLTEEATVKKFGSKEDAVKAIEAKAAELGLSSQWIANLAFESPKAYFVTMGFEPDETPKSNSTPVPHQEVNPSALEATSGAAKPNTYRWFAEMRKTDPVKYRSMAVQTAMMKAAQENPDFFN